MDLEFAFVVKDSILATAHALQELPVELIKLEIQLENVFVQLDLLTIMESVQDVLQEPSGAQLQANASLSVVKTQLIQAQPTHVSAMLDSVFLVVHAKHAHQDISSQTDIALPAQLTQFSMLLPKLAVAFQDSSPINGVFALENAEQMKSTMLLLKPVHALMD